MRTFYRVFPWDSGAAPGHHFSPGYVPPLQGSGRFDLPGRAAGVLYLAETPDHAVGEMIQGFRGSVLDADDLLRSGHPLALVEARVADDVAASVADLCDPAILARYGIRPDTLAARNRSATQAVAERVLAEGHTGLRWWSALSGDWHTTVLFLETFPARQLRYGAPVPLDTAHPAVREAAAALDVGTR